jgi:hypothetical protein
LTERDRRTLRRIVSKNHKYRSTGDSRIEYSTKTAQRELHRSNIYGTAAIAKLLVSGGNAQMPKQWCHNHKT